MRTEPLWYASMGPWLCSHGREKPLIPRRFPHSSFNGAVALQPRKGRGRGRMVGAHRPASMGPWLCSHGRARWVRHGKPRRPSFNGAVALQPRKDRDVR